ncbi:flavin-containing monooxygenase [Aspergillus neoniger CBS 115656]|uniref:FAD/NAD(P)-binding domain-containing protein n=1 Tax=Aspergillus neoniger (strain CBS 115656) TaxID=1448310 RepID=A0A318Y709_ASPNB|nr:FAD/NAD(P)-binding domain-containing protein [Aspergillus neoniger CBS 115656]PYH30076.1 FAD/NAD(P)-binding domain-containing protein [Aspergillus neoniger CBS 115656]
MPVYAPTRPDFDAIVVGAGFGGIYMCKKLTDQGLSVKVIEAAPDVGGTWYWNRYSGALYDTRSYFYRYSWNLEDLREYPWKREAIYDDVDNLWTVSLSAVPRLTARYIVTTVGLLSKINYPDIPGLKTYEGEMYHTGNWLASYDFTGKRVGVIGNGSTGVQLVTALADQNVKQLLSFQRHPQNVVPAGYAEVRNSVLGFGFEESSKPTFSVSEEERERIFEDAWVKGNGFYFMFGTFCDIFSDMEANKAAAEFIRRKIRQKVKDPVKAEKLMPYDWYARRPLCDTGYYEKFNRANVDVVNIGTNPITQIINKGIRAADGSEYELDVLIFATGFDAVPWERLKNRWKEEPSSFLGTCIPGFPNLFTVLGPAGPFTKIPA